MTDEYQTSHQKFGTVELRSIARLADAKRSSEPVLTVFHSVSLDRDLCINKILLLSMRR
jgi:hypothetical protein